MAELKLVVDALGGDDAPKTVLKGVESALAQDVGIEVILTGPKEVIVAFAEKHERVSAHPTTEFIDMGEHPAEAVRTKKDSSIVVGCRLVRDGQAAGFFSAGSTGACMSAATLVIGKIKGIKRPAIVSVVPAPKARVVFCDLGANAECKPEYLVQFAHMGRVYAQSVLGIEDPSVGLLNIGQEQTKGSEFAKTCHMLMREKVPHFLGNAEGKNLALGGFDVIVTDGFTGNIALKTYEGVGKALLLELKEALMSSKDSTANAAFAHDVLSRLKAHMSADAYGGAQLLGCRGVVVIGHGASNAEAIKNGILTTAKAIRMDMPTRLAQAIAGQA